MKPPVITNSKVTYDPPIDPLNPGPWSLLSENEDYRYWIKKIDDDGNMVMKTEHKGTEQFFEDNQRAYNDGQRWGDGKVFGSVPTDLYWKSGLAEANKQGDRGFQRRFWNDFDNRKYRKFKGRI
jgi:hypothetical protein